VKVLDLDWDVEALFEELPKYYHEPFEELNGRVVDVCEETDCR
jgi:hypothetical protein